MTDPYLENGNSLYLAVVYICCDINESNSTTPNNKQTLSEI